MCRKRDALARIEVRLSTVVIRSIPKNGLTYLNGVNRDNHRRRVHSRTPAMVSGLTDDVWTIKELIGLAVNH
jgi:hypothetical protein